VKTINFLLAVTLLYTVAGCSEKSPPAYTVIRLPAPTSDLATSPRLSGGAGDELIISWLQPGGVNGAPAALRYARYADNAWGEEATVVQGKNLFVNWADLPSVVPLGKGRLVAHWLVMSGAHAHAYDIALAESHDAGRSWSSASTPHDDGTDTEHGFVSIYPADGAAGLLWLDGRKTVNEVGADPVANGMSLRSSTQLVDELVCDCCQTDVAIAASGPIAVYRDRSVNEIRDIYVTRSIDGYWQSGVPVAHDNWQIDGCPVNGPSIAADNEHVAVAWFTATIEPLVQLAVSTDSGKSFAAPIEIARGETLGRVGVEMLPNGDVAVSWLASVEPGIFAVRAQRLSTDGSSGPVRLVAYASALSVPQMARRGSQLIFAWTQSSADSTSIETAVVDVAAL